MSFDWMEVSRRVFVAGRFREQFVRAVQERARLHCNLNLSQSQSIQRIQADLRWEFDETIGATKLPAFYRDVDDLVAAVYAHRKGDSAPPKKKRKPARRRTKKKRG